MKELSRELYSPQMRDQLGEKPPIEVFKGPQEKKEEKPKSPDVEIMEALVQAGIVGENLERVYVKILGVRIREIQGALTAYRDELGKFGG